MTVMRPAEGLPRLAASQVLDEFRRLAPEFLMPADRVESD